MAHEYVDVTGYCQRDLATFRKRLRDLKSGRIKFGKSLDGVSWAETTVEDIAFAEDKITELERILTGV